MIVKRTFSCIVISILLMFGACGKKSEVPKVFSTEAQRLEALPIPELLPEEVLDYLEWTRESEWAKVEALDSENISIYANCDDLENLYLQWEEQFIKLNWEIPRQAEWEIQLYQQDLDIDGEAEILVVLIPKGSAQWCCEELHVIDRDNKKELTDTSFPLEAFSAWVVKNAGIKPDARVVFLETELKLSKHAVSNETKLNHDLTIVIFEPDRDRILVKTILETPELQSLAILKTAFSYNGSEFQVLSYELQEFE